MILLSQMASAQTANPEFFIRLSLVPSIIDNADPDPLFFVVITDNKGNPLLAPRDLEVNLISSDSTVVEVPSSIVIPKGDYYAAGKIDTRSAGTTDIKASYLGQRVSSEITVVETSQAAEELSLTVKTPANTMLTGTSIPISIFLSDDEGNAVRAPFGISIRAEYDSNLIKLDAPTKLEEGSVYAIGTVSSLQRSGNAWIRLHADELGQKITTSVKVIADKPKSLTVRALPGNITVFDRAFYVYVGLLDETGEPAIAQENVSVHIFSNMTTNIVGRQILDEPPVLRIEKGKFGSFVNIPLEILDPGAQVIFSVSAAAEGLQPANTLLNLTRTVTKLFTQDENVRLFMETMPKVGENSELLAIVQMRDRNGTLYSPPGILEPDVFTSNVDSLEVKNIGFFGAGKTFATINLQTGFKSDDVILVGAVPGIGSANTTISVVTKQPSKTTVFSPVNDIRFNNDNRSDLYVILLDDSDRVVKAERNIQFLLTQVNEVQNVISGHSYAHFNFASNQLTQTGNVTLVALPVGVDSDVELESNIELEVTKESAATVQLIPAFRDIIGLKPMQSVMIVQLLDSIGNPYRAINDVSVTLTSSDSDIIDVDSEVKIPKGSSYALFPIYPRGSEGTGKITAAASNFAPSSTSIRSVLAPLPLSITPSLETPETNRELKLIVNSEPGARLTWKLPAELKVVEMDEQVAVDGTAELVLIPLTAEEIIVDLEGSKAGYVTNKLTYNGSVSSVIQSMNVQLITYTDSILPGESSTIEVKVTDDRGNPVEGVQLEWKVANAEVLSMSDLSDANGNASVEIMAQDQKNVQVTVTSKKEGFSAVTESTSIAVDVPSPVVGQEESGDQMFQGIPAWYMYIGLVGAVGAVASMRFMAMKKAGLKTIPSSSQQSQSQDQQQHHTDSKVHKSRWQKFFKPTQ